MTLVRIIKSLGFEQAGDIVDFRGNLEEALEREEVELLESDPREPVTSETVEDAPTEEEQPVEVPAEVPVEEPTPVETPEQSTEETAPVETPAAVEGAE